MKFYLKPVITDCADLETFFEQWQIGEKDLLITNRYILVGVYNKEPYPCNVLFQEEYGTGEPNSEMIDAMFEAAEKYSYDRVIAMGGGTVIDCANLFVFGGKIRCNDIAERGLELTHERKLIVIPTTCGTGSEVSCVSVVEFKEKKAKLNLRYPAIYTDEVVLIPQVLKNLPFEVFACSSIDALIHAVESYIAPIASVFSRAMGRCAIEKILGGYQKLTGKPYGTMPDDDDLRDFSVAATLAGIAFENGRCGPVHALSSPISFRYHFSHGKANYAVFKGVFDAYKKKNSDISAVLEVIAPVLDCSKEEALDRMFDLIAAVYPNIEKGSLGATQELCRSMAKTVLETQTFLVNNGPVKFTEDEITNIFMDSL